MALFRTSFRAMAADNQLQLWADEPQIAHRAAAAAIADVQRIEAKYSRFRDDSVTAAINRAAGGAPVVIDAETSALLRYADQCYRLSDGLFDITSGVLRRVWNWSANPPALPTAAALAAATQLIAWGSVEHDDATIRLPRTGMEIDFGGIGKEYAADRVATICVDHGVRRGLVNLAGDVRVIGAQPGDVPWRVGIVHPRQPKAVSAWLELSAGAVATSGDYERYFELDGRRYCHILNPRTGMPVAHWQSLSVVAPFCVIAGSYSTIAMLLEARAPAFLAAQRVPWMGLAADGTRVGSLPHDE